MGLKPVVDSLEGVPESVRPHYVERGGKFQLDVEGGSGGSARVEEGLRKVLAREREARRKAERRLAGFAGVDPREQDRLRRAVEKHVLEAEVSRAISESRGNARVLFPHVKARAKVVEEGGEYVVRAVDEAGEVLVSPDTGAPLALSDVVEGLRRDADFEAAFPPSVGGGAPRAGFAPAGAGAGLETSYMKALGNGDVAGAIALKNQIYAERRNKTE